MKAKRLLKKVKRDYTVISDEFAATRQRPWDEFEIIKRVILPGQKLLDAGCGNGRLAKYLSDSKIEYIGVDNNRSLLKIAGKENPDIQFKFGDVAKLPFPAGSFDVVCCIAVLHHLPGAKLQLKALRELKRVLKKDGVLIITVWNLWQKKYRKYIDRKTHEALIPWGAEKKVQRFYHAFTKAEFKRLIKRAGFSSIIDASTGRNHVYLANKGAPLR